MTTTRSEIVEKRKKAREQQLALLSANVPDAFAWLEAECGVHIDEKIPPEQMAEARKRLGWELKMIREHRLAVIFLHLHKYMELAEITTAGLFPPLPPGAFLRNHVPFPSDSFRFILLRRIRTRLRCED